MKTLFCASCGQELDVIRKGDPNTGKLMNLVVPHSCRTEVEDLPYEKERYCDRDSTKPKQNPVDKVFGQLPFADKINKGPRPSILSDKRTPEIHRKELESTAPPSLIQHIRSSELNPLTHTNPVSDRELEEPDEEM